MGFLYRNAPPVAAPRYNTAAIECPMMVISRRRPASAVWYRRHNNKGELVY